MKKIISKIKNQFIIKAIESDTLRMSVRAAKWKNDSDSPVMLMIDDFTNAWVDNNGASIVSAKYDWGGLHMAENSIFSFLENNLYSDYPEVKTTLFTVIGPISQYTRHQPFGFAESINFDQKSRDFFQTVYNDPRFEIAYHGWNHGIPGKISEQFTQEFQSFNSVENAAKQIKKGLQVYLDVFGTPCLGGKYGGWSYNQYADSSIDQSGFRWWCRDWMAKNTSGHVLDTYYEPQFFGKNDVIALPSTVHGNKWSYKQVDALIKDKQIISIEEHMGAMRPDCQIQTPNVFDDIKRLRKLYSYLRKKKVWHATASQIANYFEAYMSCRITDVGTNTFKLTYSGKIEKNTITLIVQPPNSELKNNFINTTLTCPNGKQINGKPHINKNTFLFNVDAVSGIYKLNC